MIFRSKTVKRSFNDLFSLLLRYHGMIIETERLIPRLFWERDAADVYEYLKEPAVNCFASMKLGSLGETPSARAGC